jgi:predicted SAM-dependent methyltransferase
VLEHCHFGVGGEVAKTLNEWNRVLKRGGILYVAVPDLYILSSLFVDDSLTEQERFHVMWMMYGGQMDVYDVHKVGFSESSLTAFLSNAGFCNIKRVDDFGLFRDSSVLEFKGRKISLNLMATACK